MVRATKVARYSLGITVAIIVSACGAAPPAVVRPRSEPLPVAENQQGHHETEEEEAERAMEAPPMPDQPSIAGVFLWCQTPGGRACTLATAALGTGPKDPSGLPPGLLTVEDRGNDCDEPTIVTVSARLATAFAVQPSGWRDQGGTYLDLSSLGDMYAAAGCINDGDPSRPIAKISAADGVLPRVYLVRVWDGQPTQTH